jgi:type IV secretory pathway VirB9-like protein
MHRQLLFIFLLCLPLSLKADKRIKHLTVGKDQIILVHTALGVATLIQLPERPNSAVIGDQDSFKVEYLDKGITLKPLHGFAKSNLYLYTDSKRFNLQLVTGPIAQADYVINLEEKTNPKRGALPWK